MHRADVPRAATANWRPAPACDWTCLADAATPVASGAVYDRMYGDAELAEATRLGPPPSVEEAVALELQLSDDLAPAALERMRRRFAYRNHPDRFGPTQQAHALQRMTAANALIDQALKAARARVR
jgi:hypothetical protein